VKSLGADEVLDYKTPEGDALKSPSGRKYDAVIHCATGIPWSKFSPNLTPNGKVIHLTPDFNVIVEMALKKLTFSKQKFVSLMASPNAEDLKLVGELVKDGKLRTVVDSQYPLAKAEEAWARSIEGHATGKIMVNVQQE
jgi:NADPH:quinone reductase-like Zn-dependent oxidoreductase